jgi:subtilisin-like proprotein convertase family protein
MQTNFTQKNFGYFCTRVIALALIFSASTQFSFAQENPAKANKLTAVQKAQQRSKALQTLKANPTANNDAGIITKAAAEINSPAATCTSWTFSVVAGDPPMATRPFRDGVVKTCAAPGGPCQAGIGGAFHYQIFQWVNPVAQCVTVTYNATNANFSFVTVYNAPPNLGNLCQSWVTDAGSSATVGTPIVFSFNGTAGTTYYFLVDDVGALPANGTIQIDAGVCSSTPCAGTPNPGNTTSSANPVCPGIPFTLGLQTPQNFAGITYNWQTAPTTAGPWVNTVPAGTGSTYTTSLAAPAAFRCQVTCTNSAITTISNPLQVTINPPSSCYCSGGANDMIDEKISRVRYASIDNSSTSQNGYEDFTAISTTVIQGSTLPITVDISNFFAGDLVRVWIDFNQNGNWNDPGERVVALVTSVNPGVANITIPVTTSIGPTRMRVRMYWQPTDPDPGPCGNTAYGQVEDYTVNIQPCIQGVFNTHPANQSIQCGGTANFSVTTSGSLLTYGWEYKTSAASPFWLNVTNGGVYSGATTSTLTITNAPQTMSGYVYRATIIGPCTAIDFSNSATLTVTPYIVNVSPPSATICTGSIQQLTITNTISSPVTSVFSSGAISIPVPDANVAGINHTIPVSGVSGIITDISVRFSIPAHTWPGDLCAVVRGPGGQILNLDYFITATGAGPGAGMVNTVLSSNGVPKLNTSTAPYTGTFAPDAQMTPSPGLGNPPVGPTGFQAPLVNSFTGLANFANGTTANGNWTIAIYDGFGGDIGSLTNWQVSITYVAPVFATGVWTASPAAPNTMWINAAANIPYVPGSQQTTIWVNPTVNTNYSVVVTTATPCVSNPTVVPVSVTNPITALVAPINKTVCVGSTATFTVSAGGGPLTYQWQVSTNNGLTWSNIAGATAATLTLTGVTQLMNNNLYRVTVTAAPCGSSTTAGARLNVNQLPVVTLSSSTLALVPGRVATLTATSSPAPFSATSWSWTLNGSAIAGANTNTVTANIDQQGSYQATVTDVNGCVGSSNIVTIGSDASGRLWIYPNPSTGQFQVRLYYNGAFAERRIVRIYNSIGSLVAQKEFDLVSSTAPYLSLTFDLGLNAAGTYAVKVVDKNGGKITSGLVVIQ